VRILHVFADRGVESEVLTEYGDVIRLSINPGDTNDSRPVRGDATQPPFSDGLQFDLGLFQPPCTKWSQMPSADTEAAPNLIPAARELGRDHCDHFIIENKPHAPLMDATTLSGEMFGLPIQYERAFETTFKLTHPPAQSTFGRTLSPFYYTEESREWWAATKGYPPDYGHEHLAKNCIPRPYLEHLLRAWISATDDDERPDYSDYDKQMAARRSREQNQNLTDY
jgi:hypothetical protein